jgi:hypothetical protein
MAVADVYVMSSLTPQTLASGFRSRHGSASLLPKLTGKVVAMKDFGTVLTLHRESRAAILAQLREIYGGRFVKVWGNGQRLEWTGKVGFLGGVTGVIDEQYSQGSTIRVERAFSDRRLEATPKTVQSIRDVDMSAELAAVLRRLVVERSEACLRHGWQAPWLFLSEAGTPLNKQNVERAMVRIARRAGLPHFTPHDLRHTFASLLLQRGENPKYVQQQLGHASLSMTTDLYGRWLRAVPTRGGVNALE